MEKLNFREFLLACEQNVPGYHLDGNTNSSGGGYLNSQATGSQDQGTGAKQETGPSSPFGNAYSNDLGLPTLIERGRIVSRVHDRPRPKLEFRDGGYVEFANRDHWFKITRGKTNIYDVQPGDRVDVEYHANRFDTSKNAKTPRIVMIY